MDFMGHPSPLKWKSLTTLLVRSELRTLPPRLALVLLLRSPRTHCSACDLQFQFRKTPRSSYNCYIKYTVYNTRCYNCTIMRCKIVHDRRYPRTSFEKTRWQSLQKTSSCEDSLTGSYVIVNLCLFYVEEQIGKHIYILKLPAKVRLYPLIPVNSLRPCCIASLRPNVPVATQEDDDEEIDVSHIYYYVCIKPLRGRCVKYVLFMTHFNDDDVPLVWHRLNDVHRTTKVLHEFLETPKWPVLTQTWAFIPRLHACSSIAHSQVSLIAKKGSQVNRGSWPLGCLIDM
jgi:hypothetical protein